MDVFYELSLLLALAVLVSVVMRALKQPLIVGYILTGILAGPYVFGLVTSSQELELFSKIGIVILLFIVGLQLNPKIIREVGKVSLVTGIGQIVFTSLIGFLIALLLGIDRVAAMYVAIALTFSSTIIILKLLSDRGDLEKLYAKIAIGFLLVQDVVATIILIVVALLANSGAEQLEGVILATLGKGIALFVGLAVVSHFWLAKLVRYLAASQELLFLFSAAFALGLASLLSAIGFSMEIGALVAGATLAVTPYATEMASRLKPLRDLFILIFFILLGSHMQLSDLGNMLIPALIFSVFVLVGNPIIVVLLMNVLGYGKKTGFMAGLAVAQISEFSLILAALGFQVGHVSSQVLSLITLVGLITIAGSTYLILYADSIYPRAAKFLSWFELFNKRANESERKVKEAQIILFGYDRVGADFVKVFKTLKRPYLVVDFNPESIERLEALGLPYRFGDASDQDFLAELPLEQVKLVVSTIPEVATNIMIQRRLNDVSSGAASVLLAHSAEQAEELYEEGASYVLIPHLLGGKYAAKMIEKYGLKRERYERARFAHVHELEKRQSLILPR